MILPMNQKRWHHMSNIKIGYARVSTTDQNLDRQLDLLKEKGCDTIYQEKMTGTKVNRPEFEKMMSTLREGDTLIVESFSRLSRSTKDLLEIVEKLNAVGVNLVSSKEQLDTTTSTGQLMLTMLSALSQFERDIIAERTKEGLKAARARGRKGGRKPVGNEETKRRAISLYEANAMTNPEIAKVSGVSTATFSRWVAEHKRQSTRED